MKRAVSNKNMVSARGKFNPKSQEFCEDWAPEYVQQFDAGRRELGKENSYFQSSVKDRSANTSDMSQAKGHLFN